MGRLCKCSDILYVWKIINRIITWIPSLCNGNSAALMTDEWEYMNDYPRCILFFTLLSITGKYIIYIWDMEALKAINSNKYFRLCKAKWVLVIRDSTCSIMFAMSTCPQTPFALVQSNLTDHQSGSCRGRWPLCMEQLVRSVGSSSGRTSIVLKSWQMKRSYGRWLWCGLPDFNDYPLISKFSFLLALMVWSQHSALGAHSDQGI